MWSKSRCYQEKPYVLVSISSVPNVSTEKTGMECKEKKKKAHTTKHTLRYVLHVGMLHAIFRFILYREGRGKGGGGGGKVKIWR